MNKQEVYAYLTAHGIAYEVMEHSAVHNMAEVEALSLPHPEWDAKNLFVRDDKRQVYCLITVRGDARVNLTAFRHARGLRPLTFASAEEMKELLSLTPGAVTPLGLMNDAAHRVRFFLDDTFRGGKIALHPNDNTATLWMDADDLMKLLQSLGISAEYVTC